MASKKTDFIRSPFFYVGDKFKLLSQLEENFPSDIDRFIEPFCGGGSVFLNTPAKSYFLNDINSYMINLHNFLIENAKNPKIFWTNVEKYIDNYNLSATYLGRDVPPNYRKDFVKTYFAKYNKESYYKMRADFNKDKTNNMLLYLLLIYGFNRMLRFNTTGNFNLPVGNVDFNNNVVNALNNYFSYVNNKDINLYNYDFEKFINEIEPNSTDFIYVDPPYLITDSEYNKLWNEENEIRLLNLLDYLDNNNIRFAISNIIKHKERFNNTFNDWAKKYNIIPIKSNYISYHDNTEKKSIEVLVKNY